MGRRHYQVRHLFAEIRHRGYTGRFSHCSRISSAPWRSGAPSLDDDEQEAQPRSACDADPMTGRVISPLTAAALCVKLPRGQIDRPAGRQRRCAKGGVCQTTTMRRLAIQFRGLLRSGTTERLDAWLNRRTRVSDLCDAAFREDDTPGSGGRSKRLSEPWSNGQTEGQINKLNPQASHVWPCRR